MSRICLVGSTPEFATFVEAAFAGGAPVTLTPVEATGFDPETVAQIVAIDPDLVVVGPGIPDSDALKIIGEVDVAAPHLSSILVAHPTAELWPQSLHAGARDIVAPLSGASTIRECFERAIEAGRRLRGAAAEAPSSPSAGRVFAVVSPKGGSGKTTVAANLAATVAMQRPDDVVLADFDVQFGDIGYAFRLEPEYSLLNAVAPGVTPTVLKGFLTPHSSKVLTLAAPERPEDADDIDPEAARDVVQTLSKLFGVVIVDTAAGMDERTLTVLDAATDVILVTATDVPSVRAAVKEFEILQRLGLLDKRRHHLVLNRADARVGLSAGDIEETIGLKASLSIPSTRAIPTALNLGEPAVLADQRGSVARSFQKFAEGLGVLPTSPDGNRAWRFGR
jgi:pilus assembly protein CpaE